MVEGLNQLSLKLKRVIPNAVEGELRRELAKHAEKIVATAKSLAPFKSGDLKDSIGWVFGTQIPDGAFALGEVRGGNSSLVVTIYAGSEDAFYVFFQEFGTRERSANPFFFPAYRLHRRAARTGMTKAIKRGLQKGAA